MMNHSMTDVAFELMSKRKKAVPFKKLWEEVSGIMGYSESVAMNKVSTFYANMSLDTRFALVEDGKWDLRSRHTYNETHKDLDEILSDLDDSNDEYEDNDENYDDENSENNNEEKETYSSMSEEEDY